MWLVWLVVGILAVLFGGVCYLVAAHLEFIEGIIALAIGEVGGGAATVFLIVIFMLLIITAIEFWKYLTSKLKK